MQQIADWLQTLGLGQYAQRFAENDISFSILPDLTDQDLKELGVASLGHRRQLLRAIIELKGSETLAPKPNQVPLAWWDRSSARPPTPSAPVDAPPVPPAVPIGRGASSPCASAG